MVVILEKSWRLLRWLLKIDDWQKIKEDTYMEEGRSEWLKICNMLEITSVFQATWCPRYVTSKTDMKIY